LNKVKDWFTVEENGVCTLIVGESVVGRIGFDGVDGGEGG